MATYFLIAGEASGDRHAAALIKQIQQRDPEAHFSGLGGDLMAAAGCHLYQDYRKMAFMGFAAVLRHIKVWAWKRRRVHQIAHLCDQVFGIFPFEPAFYTRYGYECTYVGNPTAEELSRTPRVPMDLRRPRSIAILPGSRQSEISHCLPRMLEAAHRFPNYAITVCAAPGIEDAFYTPYLRAGECLTRDTYGTVQQAAAAIVNSGTATLETALLGCPQVAVYHLTGSRLVGLIRWAQPLFFSIPYFTLVNIIAGKQVIKECIANEFTTDKVANELQRLLTDDDYKKNMLASYEHIRSLLGSQPAAATAAEYIISRNRS